MPKFFAGETPPKPAAWTDDTYDDNDGTAIREIVSQIIDIRHAQSMIQSDHEQWSGWLNIGQQLGCDRDLRPRKNELDHDGENWNVKRSLFGSSWDLRQVTYQPEDLIARPVCATAEGRVQSTVH